MGDSFLPLNLWITPIFSQWDIKIIIFIYSFSNWIFEIVIIHLIGRKSIFQKKCRIIKLFRIRKIRWWGGQLTFLVIFDNLVYLSFDRIVSVITFYSLIWEYFLADFYSLSYFFYVAWSRRFRSNKILIKIFLQLLFINLCVQRTILWYEVNLLFFNDLVHFRTIWRRWQWSSLMNKLNVSPFSLIIFFFLFQITENIRTILIIAVILFIFLTKFNLFLWDDATFDRLRYKFCWQRVIFFLLFYWRR